VKLLVTGGAGFVGSALVRGIVAGAHPDLAGAQVVVLDKLTYAAGGFDNLGPAAGSGRVRLVHGDVCDPATADEVTAGCDAILHLAAESHVDRSILDGSVFALTNVLGTQTLLAAAVRHRVDRFVQVSTDEVYGSIATGAWTEASPLAPNSPYAATKAGADLMARAYGHTHGLDVRITRGSNTYGPHQYPEKIVPLFTTALLDGDTVPLYGNGANIREWLHVEDHCRGVVAALVRGRAGEIYNLGGGRALSNRELTGMLLALTGRNEDSVRHVADRPGHDLRYALDGAKAARELGYGPVIPLEDGLAATVDWYRRNRPWWEPRRHR